MPNLCLFLYLHSPVRLRHFPALEIGKHTPYVDEVATFDLWKRLAEQSYQPALESMIRAAKTYGENYRVSVYLPGSVFEEMKTWAPQLLPLLAALNDTGAVEWLAGPYYPSLAFWFSPQEFDRQTDLQQEWIQAQFGQQATVLCNTDLMYHNLVGYYGYKSGYEGVIAEGVDSWLNGRSCNYLYSPFHREDFPVMVRNRNLSEDLTHRFQDNNWSEYPLDAEKYASWIAGGEGEITLVGFPLETLGITHSVHSGILDFWENLPGKLLEKGVRWMKASEALKSSQPRGGYGGEGYSSWLSKGDALAIWRGNSWQSEALERISEMEELVLKRGNQDSVKVWRWFQQADHLLFMHNQDHVDGLGSLRSRPFKTPHDAYICFMNALADFQIKLEGN